MSSVKTYLVKDCFRTIQGEGYYAGSPAVFLRLAGCNMWSGEEEDRLRDAARNDARCPTWCDTDFRAEGAKRMTAQEVATMVGAKLWNVRHIVITGGEPLLQVDDTLIAALRALPEIPQIAVETNGSVEPKFADRGVWITLSPKQPRAKLVINAMRVSELKLVVPAYDPMEWESFPVGHRFLQPQASLDGRNDNNEQQAARYVINVGTWRLSLQTHKIVSVP